MPSCARSETYWTHNCPLLPPLAALAAGILTARFTEFQPAELAAGCGALFALALAGLWIRSRATSAAACLTGLMLAGALVAHAHRPPPPPELEQEGMLLLSGCVVEPPALFEDRGQLVVELERGARVRLTQGGAAFRNVRYGELVEMVARVRRPRQFVNPGAFDFRAYLARRDIFWVGTARPDAPLKRLPGECGNRFHRAMFALRSSALDRLRNLYADQPYASGMMRGILMGDSAGLRKVWTEDFRSTGTFHALVISGAHVAVLAAFFLFLLRVCLVPQGWALAVVAAGAWIYAVVTGWQPPVLRSAAGLTVFALGKFLYRERNLMNLLAAVAIGFLLLDPDQLFEASFQLSFLSVAFIAAFAVPLMEKTSGPYGAGLRDLTNADRDARMPPRVAQFRVELRLLAETAHLWTRLPRTWCLSALALCMRCVHYAYDLAVTSALVQVGLLLPMAAYFHRVSLTGLSANIAIVPLMGLVVPIGFVALFTGWAFPARIAGELLEFSRAAAGWHASLEPNWRIPMPPLWLGIAIALALIGTALARRIPWRIAGGISQAVLLALLIWHPFTPDFERGTLELTAIDVGQGDSFLAAFPDGKLMMMDAGGLASFPRRGAAPRQGLDIGEDVVSPYLWSRSIRALNAVALSHAHEDHMGGMIALLKNFRVNELWTGAVPESEAWAAVREEAHKRNVKIVRFALGDRFEYGGAQVEVLAPPREYRAGNAAHNRDSLVLRLTYGARSFLLSGDIERPAEDELPGVRVDVLKVAHHGSRTSTGEQFLDAARPAFAVISAGRENSYGHPHPDVLERLRKRGVTVLRTDQSGLVTIRTDGKWIRFETPGMAPFSLDAAFASRF
ncbi:MAG: ComEC/Rec2 family competence protein [Bryobacteraceae bacterium]